MLIGCGASARAPALTANSPAEASNATPNKTRKRWCIKDPSPLCSSEFAIGALCPPARHQSLERAQRDVDDDADDPDRDHPRHHHGCIQIALALNHQVTDTGGNDDQLGADERLPTEPRTDSQTGHDRG